MIWISTVTWELRSDVCAAAEGTLSSVLSYSVPEFYQTMKERGNPPPPPKIWDQTHFHGERKKYYVQSRRGDKSEHLPRIHHHLTHFCFFTYDIGRVHISNIQYEMFLEVEDRQDWCQIGIPKKIFLAREETLTSNSPVFLTESNCSFVSLFKRPLESTAMLLLSSKLGSTKRSLRFRVFFRMDEVLPVIFEVFMIHYIQLYLLFFALKKVSCSQKSSFPNLLKKDLWNGITRTSKNPQRKRILIGVIYQGWRKFEII